jgi:hypothetical protein
MKVVSTLVFLALSVCGCSGHAGSSSFASRPFTGNGAPGIPELGTLKGTITQSHETCGGPVDPSQPPPTCQVVTEPYTDQVALLGLSPDQSSGLYVYVLSTWIVPDSAGHFSVDDAPGTYYLVSQGELMQVGLNALSQGIPQPLAASKYLPNFVQGPFSVVADQATTIDLKLEMPPAPVTIGVGN